MGYKKTMILFIILSTINLLNATLSLPKTSELVQKVQPLNIKQCPFKKGSLTVICGSMCSGKSEELIKQVGRFILAGFDVQAFKPAIDDRKLLTLEQDPLTYIPSRSGSWIECTAVKTVDEMKEIIKKQTAQVIAIDEIHFFTPEKDSLILFIRSLVESGKKVIVSGLELDFRSEAFGPMPELLAFADNVIKLKAICNICGDDTFCISQRLIDGKPAHYNDPLIIVGSSQYEPRCRKCYIIRKD